MASPAPVPHVPAWKRLGLKLRFATELPTQPDADDGNLSSTIDNNETGLENHIRKRKLTPELGGDISSKKQKREDKLSENETPNLGFSDKKDQRKHKKSASGAEEASEVQRQKPSESKGSARKSVSFAEGTKKADGSPELEPESVSEQAPLTSDQKRAEKRQKREQRSKNHSAQNSNPKTPSAPSDRILDYLTTYYSSRSEWKFQKNRETVILKNALSVDRIPGSYNPALSTYLTSLKSAAAKGRVAQSALEAIEADEKINEEHNTEYTQAITLLRAQLAELGQNIPEAEADAQQGSLNDDQLKRFARRKRAELVYFAVSGQIAKETKPSVSKEETKPSVKRKRKTRTAMVEENYTSSSSDSDNDSESSSESENDGSDSSSSDTNQKGLQKSEIQSSWPPSVSSSSSSELSSDSDTTSSGSDSDSDSDVTSNSNSDSD
ncbi:hypothetical protein D8B26_003314 [Coccidioides posadasii str. Silveira]|uniref:Uncharacterized protein n=1 Tax=Coccidioides posadasii (strain RMSCC 757 / Silveira) TaxID=443226 RepID=E9D017_COCPS|nr:conserved hypothetical protein [Coccidioides posadasii str. Silveira]QVM08633.1 hypothetical protein D8B26_003314 [Coccidioides posadasii str. Silveira]